MRFFSLLCSLLLVTGCSSLNSDPHPDNTSLTESLPLTPKQQLLQQPNLLMLNQPQVDGATKTRFQQAIRLKKAKQLDQAEAALQRLSETHPELASVWMHLGDIALLNEQTDLALRHYQQTIALSPYHYFAHNRLGLLLRQQGQFDQALQQYSQAIEAWPGFAPAYRNRAILLDLYMGQKQRALQDYQTYQLLADDPPSNLNGWLVDLQQQIAAQTGESLNGN
ncbi:tetratricopeptide repeat protein [Neptunicella sp. SCSIO 80796]|uniref:tetratricopeptide repeat protein n=1 Tax=Neptunicella plasticusilytica TaxID=3117012 RepID=UPI003A4DAFF7